MVSPLLGRFLVSFNLQSTICGLQSAVCSLQSAVCSLQSAVCKCHTVVLSTLKLTQSQVGIVGLKIVNSLNRINHRIKFRKRNRFYLLDFCCIFYRFVDFLTLNTLTQLYLKKTYTHFRPILFPEVTE